MSDEQGIWAQCLVLVNDEEQYSLWPSQKSVPQGWKSVRGGTQEECLRYIDEVWKDITPASVRRALGR